MSCMLLMSAVRTIRAERRNPPVSARAGAGLRGATKERPLRSRTRVYAWRNNETMSLINTMHLLRYTT